MIFCIKMYCFGTFNSLTLFRSRDQGSFKYNLVRLNTTSSLNLLSRLLRQNRDGASSFKTDNTLDVVINPNDVISMIFSNLKFRVPLRFCP